MSIPTRVMAILALLTACALFVSVNYPAGKMLSLIFEYARATPESALFVGDVMLARHVETRIAEVGTERFFERVRPLHEGSKYVFGNFEAALPRIHVPTPILTFQFSVDPKLAPLLADAGMTHVSLANNHAYDHGDEGYGNAIAVLDEADLIPFGHPKEVASSSTSVITLDQRKVAVIGIHAVWNDPSRAEIVRELNRVSSSTDIQIVYVHWGTEYEGVHSAYQETFARFLAESGADIIIGHHPHVVQDIGVVEGVPVFYSLGNYVFDQYWDEEVRTGLAVRLSLERHAYVFDIVPIAIDRAQPRVMSDSEAEKVLEALAKRSDPALRTEIAKGSLRVPR